jgi:regulator of RNase E activity RraA
MTLRDQLMRVGTASLYEAAGTGSMSASIRPVGPSRGFAGRATTARSPAGDNLVLHQMLRRRFRDEVLVVDAGQATLQAVWGEVMSVAAKTAGLSGLVLDGAVRDLASIARVGFPIYARGAAIPGPLKQGPGDTDCIVTCGGTNVCPGDWVVADEDGVVVVADEVVEDVLARAEQREALERAIIARLEAGISSTWDELGLAPV